ncbi:MAG: hypothetical protein F2585_07200 [Actinobacteria bacterium]|nr:hypothetical protein [Actinomycetota bacterium]
MHPTQRRLVIALFVTLSCLPLLVIDMLGSTSGASETNATASDVPESSLVMLATPSTAAAPASVVLETTTVPPATVPAVPVPTTSAPRVVQAPPTTAAPVYLPPPPPPIINSSDAAFMACVRERESHGDYTAVDPSGQFMGAYQIYQGGWDSIAGSMGRGDLVGVRPHQASPADQDAVAYAMLAKLGRSPWNFACS